MSNKKENVISLFSSQNIPGTNYSDAKFFSAKEKEKAFRCFTRVLKERDINKMDHNLYDHLHLHCSFIAHFNINGFKAKYSGEGFRRFVQHFDKNSPFFCHNIIWYAEYADIIKDMVELAMVMAPQIYAELDAKVQSVELALCRTLAEKYGLKLLEQEQGLKGECSMDNQARQGVLATGLSNFKEVIGK